MQIYLSSLNLFYRFSAAIIHVCLKFRYQRFLIYYYSLCISFKILLYCSSKHVRSPNHPNGMNVSFIKETFMKK